jgi:hypothetical protein
MRSTCALLAIVLATLCHAQLADDQQRSSPHPRKWMSMKITEPSDKTWKGIKAEADNAIANLKKDTAANRKLKILKLAGNVQGYFVKTRDAYRLARYDLAFREDVTAAKAGAAVAAALSNCEGASDIEFMKTAYTAGCLREVAGEWKDLGLQLYQREPTNVPLQMAMVRDCWQGTARPWPMIQKSIEVNEDLFEKKLWPSGTDINANRGNLWIAAYYTTKRKSHLDNAIKYTEINLNTHTDPEKREICQLWLDDLKKALKDKKYVSG